MGPDDASTNLLERARAAHRHGRLSESLPLFAEAFEAAENAGDLVAAGEALLGLGGFWAHERRADDEYARYRYWMGATRDRLVDRDHVLQARLAVRIAADAWHAEGSRDEEFVDAIDVVRRTGDAPALCEALLLRHHVLMGPHDADARTHVTSEFVNVAVSCGDSRWLALALMKQTIDGLVGGDPGARKTLERLRELAERDRFDDIGYFVRMVDVMASMRAGQLDTIEAEMSAALAFGEEIGEVDAMMLWSGQLLALRWLQGRVTELLPLVDDLMYSPNVSRFNRVYPAVAAALLAEIGRHDDARSALARVDPTLTFAPVERDGLAPSSVWLMTMFTVVEAVHFLGDVTLAATAYHQLFPFAHLPFIGSVGIVCLGSVHRSLALCALTQGDRSLARKHYESATEQNLRFGNYSALAISRAELAVLLAQSETTTDLDEANALLHAAQHVATELGVQRRIETCASVIAALERSSSSGVRSCSLIGRSWVVESESERTVVSDMVGMRALVQLLSNPGVGIPATHLGGSLVDFDATPIIDDVALRSLRNRMRALEAELDRADWLGDASRASAATAERDAIAAELSRSLGLNGRARRFAATDERARTSVTKALRRAIAHLADGAPDLGAHLAVSVKTGSLCLYSPGEGAAPWRVSGGIRNSTRQ